MITITNEDLEVLQTTICNALKFTPQEDWERIIKEIFEDRLLGLRYVAHFDGSAKPNPGEIKIGGRITTPGAKSEVYTYSKELGFGTNNEAEYQSLIHIAKKLVELGTRSATIFGDSQLVVNQVNGLWRVKDERMRNFKSAALSILSKIPHWELGHVYRDQNTEADALTR